MIEPVWAECQEQKLGFCLDSCYLPFVVFADNFWILALSSTMMHKIYLMLLEALAKAGWRLPLDRVTWSTNLDDTWHWDWCHEELTAARKGKNEGFLVLGSLLTVDGMSHKDMCRRVMCAEGAFNAHAHFWAAKGSTRKQRAKLLEKVSVSVLCWNSWHLECVCR